MAGLLNDVDLIGLELSVDAAVDQQLKAKRDLRASAEAKICQAFLRKQCNKGMNCEVRSLFRPFHSPLPCLRTEASPSLSPHLLDSCAICAPTFASTGFVRCAKRMSSASTSIFTICPAWYVKTPDVPLAPPPALLSLTLSCISFPSPQPECQFFSQFGTCIAGEDCIFLHLAPPDVIRDCPAYEYVTSQSCFRH